MAKKVRLNLKSQLKRPEPKPDGYELAHLAREMDANEKELPVLDRSNNRRPNLDELDRKEE